MSKQAEKMMKLTNMAKSYLVENETVVNKVLGMYNGMASKSFALGNGIMIATNKRLLFCNKKHIASFDYEKISNINLKKIIGGHELEFSYNKNKIILTNVSEKSEVEELFNFVTNPTSIDSDFNNLFKDTEVPLNENVKKIKETKCTCKACGKVWFYGKEEAFKNFGEKLESAGNSMSNAGKDMMCCSGCLPAAFIPNKQEKEVKDLNKCPECGSKAITKEVVVHDVE